MITIDCGAGKNHNEVRCSYQDRHLLTIEFGCRFVHRPIKIILQTFSFTCHLYREILFKL